MSKLLIWLITLIVVAGVVFFIGPREPVEETITFDSASIGNNVDDYLAKREANYTDIKPGAQKQMIWLDPVTKAKQPWSIVYIHGFSASLAEIRPVPDLVAKDIGANLFYTRLTGHGRTGDAMAQAKVNDWYNDVAEAMAVGRATGERVIVIGTSTGATLATWAATQPKLMKDVVGLIAVAPNFAVQDPSAVALSFPWARQLLPMIFGKYRQWEPKNEEQGIWWSTRYPLVALLPMQASVDRAAEIAFEGLNVPALFVFHDKDEVVRSAMTRQVVERWGKYSDTKTEIFEIKESSDPSNHVITGDILSPNNTQPVASKIAAWIKAL